jgi:hypothetical protein
MKADLVTPATFDVQLDYGMICPFADLTLPITRTEGYPDRHQTPVYIYITFATLRSGNSNPLAAQSYSP